MKPGYFISIIIIAVYIFHSCDQQSKSTAVHEESLITITNSINESEGETTIPFNRNEASGSQQTAHQQKPSIDKSVIADESSEIMTAIVNPEEDEVELQASASHVKQGEQALIEMKNL